MQQVEATDRFRPYSVCGAITDNFKALVGVRIAPGWTLETRALLGGVKGCTHLVELLGPIATTAFQTIYPARVKRDGSADPAQARRCSTPATRIAVGRPAREAEVAGVLRGSTGPET